MCNFYISWDHLNPAWIPIQHYTLSSLQCGPCNSELSLYQSSSIHIFVFEANHSLTTSFSFQCLNAAYPTHIYEVPTHWRGERAKWRWNTALEGIEMFCNFNNSDVDMFTLNEREYTHILETLVGQGKSCRNTRGHVDCGVTLYVITRDWVGSERGGRSHRGASIPHMVEWGRLASSQSQSSKDGHRGSTQHRRDICVIQAHWTRHQIRLAVEYSFCHIVLFHYNPATVGERS